VEVRADSRLTTQRGVTAALDDAELSYCGPAPADVVDPWRAHFARMGGMQRFFGERMTEVTTAILDARRSPAHRSLCSVRVVVARRVETPRRPTP
jgi:hypothetical protein